MKNRNIPACNAALPETLRACDAGAVALRAGTFATILLAFALLCAAPAPKAFGVVPAPDGGYPGGNTAEGQNSLLSRTTGTYNTAVGIFSALSLTGGSFCTGVGAGTLLSNTADQNTATGAGVLLSNTTGTFNTANGTFALFLNTEGDSNTATGRSALQNNATGNSNTANGDLALFSNTADGNTAIGASALLTNTTGGTLGNIQGFDVGPNVAVGWQALESNTVASANTAVGYQALHSFTTGPVGFEQLGLCTAVGFQALANSTGGFGNSAFGYQALMNNTDGAGNTAIGPRALFNNSVGSGNTAIGRAALSSSTGDDNVALGQNAGVGVTTADNVICIGAVGDNVDNSCYIGNIFNAISSGGAAVFVNSLGKLGTSTSSRRFKEEIRPMDTASEVLLALQPVTFRYKKEFDPTGAAQFGLVAEEVEKVNPDLVVRDKEGKPYTVRYDQVNAMLLNEFLKEHRKVEEQTGKLENQSRKIQEQDTTITQLKKELETVVARQKEQDEQLQKVSAQIEVRLPVTKVTLSSQ
jgi:hypothetical protein